MIKNYFRVAFRYLVKNRFSSLINIGGLAIGMAVAILIGLWIYDEVTFNKYHRNYDRIAAVLQNQTFNGEIATWWGEAQQLAPELRKTYGNHFRYIVRETGNNDHLLQLGDKKLKTKGNYMDPEAPDMLTLKMTTGNTSGLNDPTSVVLAASTAKALFGTNDPLGKTVTIDSKQQAKVTGVYEDIPSNSSFSGTNFIAPFLTKMKLEGYDTTLHWGNSWFATLVQINESADMRTVSASIKDAKLKSSPGDARFKPVLFLHPMSRWQLYGDFKNGVSSGGRILYVRLFGVIGFFVLLLACINFMNLSTARSEKRAKEVGIRKAIGSLRSQLIGQFFSESLLVALFAFVVSIGLVQLLLPFFNQVADKKMSILWGQPLFWITGIGFSILTGLVAGSYPALYLSSFRPIKVLKGSFRVGRLASLPRKALVVVQFTVSVILIIGTICVFRQIKFVQDRPVGYTRAGIVMLGLQRPDIQAHVETFRRDLIRTGVVKEVAFSESPITNAWTTNMGYSWPDKPVGMQEQFTSVGVSPEYGPVTGWKIVQGRDFSRDYATDSSGFIINEAAAKYMGLKDPIGKIVKWGDNGSYTIIGVVKDMIMQSPYEPVKQTIFYLSRYGFSKLSVAEVRLLPQANVADALGKMKAVYAKYDADNPFDYQFVDEEYAKKFTNEQRVGKLAGFFTILAILISCLGLFGLASFVAEQRTREIGIRKVLGASIASVWNLLTREFVLLVGLSLLIGTPVAWWLMSDWLQNYSYHASLSWWIFASAGAGAIGITLLTVSFQAIKAGLTSPVKSLRSE
jgi:ABC-type antimicrobial peptide transport system permease subunit